MAKKEFKIGEEFQCGLIKLRCEANRGCKDCVFRCIDYCSIVIRDIVGSCSSIEREDKTGVAFVKVEE